MAIKRGTAAAVGAPVPASEVGGISGIVPSGASSTGAGALFQGVGGGWEEANTDALVRMIVMAEAPEKSGKSHFMLTSPAKKRGKREGLGIINFDIGLEGVVQKFQHVKKIYRSTYRVKIPRAPAAGWSQQQINEIAAAASAVWNKVMDDYQYGLEHFRTIGLDTSTEMWELLRVARFGKMEQVKPHHYGPVNAEFREMIRMAYDADVNLVMLHKMKDEYANDQRTGRLKASGFGDAAYMSQVNLLLLKQPYPGDEGTGIGAGEMRYTATVKYQGCRLRPELEGTTFWQPECSFADIAMQVWPGSKPGDWE